MAVKLTKWQIYNVSEFTDISLHKNLRFSQLSQDTIILSCSGNLTPPPSSYQPTTHFWKMKIFRTLTNAVLILFWTNREYTYFNHMNKLAWWFRMEWPFFDSVRVILSIKWSDEQCTIALGADTGLKEGYLTSFWILRIVDRSHLINYIFIHVCLDKQELAEFFSVYCIKLNLLPNRMRLILFG